MLKFIDLNLVKVAIIGVFATWVAYTALKLKSEKSTSTLQVKLFFVSVVSIFIALPFIDAYMRFSTAQENIKSFHSGGSLICKGSNGNEYGVSSGNGWIEDKNFFTKNSLMIRVDNCEERRKIKR